MNFKSFIIRRLLLSIFVIFGLSIVIFVIARVVPGDPARMSLGPRAPEEVAQKLREEMYLDKSLPEQYIYWVKGIFTGDFGKSLISKRPVLQDIKEYFPATMELAFFSGIIMVVFAIIFGTIAARYKDSWVDSSIRIMTYVGISIPSFVVAIIFMLIFGYLWPILPVLGRFTQGMGHSETVTITGLLTLDNLLQGNFVAAWDAFKHAILPAVALSLGRTFQESRITRSSMIDNMRKDYILTARGFGIPERIIFFKYLLKPSLIPTVSMMGLDFANSFANAFLVERIFCWPGISRYGINAMLNKDLNAISAVIITFGMIFVIVNIIVDIIISFLEPRIRFSRD